MDDSLSNNEHREFARRVDEHFDRIDARLAILEEEMKSYRELAISIEKIGMSTERLCNEIEKQGKRLEALEDRDGQKWRSTVSTVLTVVIGALIGFVFTNIGIA